MAVHVTVNTGATRDAIHVAVSGAPGAMRDGPDGQAMLVRAGMVALSHIKQAFIVKARGGTDDAGDRWAPLKPSTIAYSRTRSRGRGGRTRGERASPSRPSQALSDTQRERWWDLYRQGLAIYKGDKGAAAKRAWGILKGEGARTLFDKYAGRSVEILRDTGLLLNSLTPGYRGPGGVFRLESNAVVVGTNVPYAVYHHHGTRRMPQRRLWPDPMRWPESWWRDILEQVGQGAADIVLQRVRDA